MMEDNDTKLINGIKSKNIEAMEAFYRRYENSIYCFSIKKLNNEFDASDIVNIVMMEVWNTAHRFKGESKVSTWLLGIANHRIIDLLRKRKRKTIDIDDTPDITDESVNMNKVIEASQNSRFIKYCLKKINAEQQQVLQLLFFNEATYEEISDVISCPIGTVKSRIYHAKNAIKKCLEKRIIE